MDIPYEFGCMSEKTSQLNPKLTLFVGFHSTLLYELSISGFKTLWITDPKIHNFNLKNILKVELKNDFYSSIEGLNLSKLEKLFNKRLEIISQNNVFKNPEKIKEFPKICESSTNIQN